MDPKLVRNFRVQAVALGVIWIIFGVAPLITIGFAVALDWTPLGRMAQAAVALVLLAMSGAAVALGVATCLKKLWAFYTGLVLSYLLLFVFVVSLNVCSIVMVIPVVLQTHRVIRWAGQLRAAGIPLTAPERGMTGRGDSGCG